MAANVYRLPGNKVTVTGRPDWIRSMARGAYLFGPAHRALMRSVRSNDRDRLHRSERRWSRSAARAIDLTIETSGLHHVDPHRPYIVLPLHEGFTDLLAIQEIPLPMVYAATAELFEWEYLGAFLSESHQPSISPTNGADAYRTILRAGKAASARRESIVVFPQGTVLGIEVAFHAGAFSAANHLGLPVLPVVLTGAATVWDHPFSMELHFGQTIRMEVLAPIAPTDAIAAAKDIEAEMKDRALAATPQPRRFIPDRDGWWDNYPYEIDARFDTLHRLVEQHRARWLRYRSTVDGR